MEEKLIKKVFDDAHHMFSSDLPSNDFRLKAIKRFFKDFKGKLILDVGCGKGRFMKKLIREGVFNSRYRYIPKNVNREIDGREAPADRR